jgi:hypothetical protein
VPNLLMLASCVGHVDAIRTPFPRPLPDRNLSSRAPGAHNAMALIRKCGMGSPLVLLGVCQA